MKNKGTAGADTHRAKRDQWIKDDEAGKAEDRERRSRKSKGCVCPLIRDIEGRFQDCTCPCSEEE